MSITFAECPRCTNEARLRNREFSDQAMSAMLAWGEIQADGVEKPICDECYDELRDVLIDRADELLEPIPAPTPAAKPKKKARKKANRRAS